MADVLQRLSTFNLSIRSWGGLVDLLPSHLPSPRPTVTALQVPKLFREPYIRAGYRPVHQDWRCYFLSLFQRHNETLNVWTHLLAAPVLLIRWWAHVGTLGYTFNAASLPLSLFLVSALTYLALSALAHLLQSHSEQAHYFFFFMDYVGVAVYQYGCSLAHYFYSSEPSWRRSAGQLFLPGAALLGLMSCVGCCFAKYRYKRPYPLRRKVCQLIPTSLAYLLDISPVAHRLLTTPWNGEAPAFHALQIACFMLSALFFCCPIPERFFPGRCDFVGHAHQIFHLFLSLCTLFQLEALFRDYAQRRNTLEREFGRRQLWWACVSFPLLCVCCILTALLTMRSMTHKQKNRKDKEK